MSRIYYVLVTSVKTSRIMNKYENTDVDTLIDDLKFLYRLTETDLSLLLSGSRVTKNKLNFRSTYIDF